MGLAIARGIVEAHGGRIRVEARAGKAGARVVFTLPIGDEETAADRPHEPAAGQTGGATRAAAATGEADKVL
jgi:hypothetical protein